MYSHQLIDDLNKVIKMIKNKKDANMPIVLFETMIPLIQKAQKFHIDAGDDIVLLRQKILKSVPIFSDMTEYLKLPYPVTYFDYPINHFTEDVTEETKTSKGAVLCLQANPKIITIETFSYSNFFKMWCMGNLKYMIEIRPYTEGIGGNVHVIPNFSPGPDHSTNDNWIEKASNEDIPDLTIANIAILLLNCKNIQTISQFPSSSLNKKRIKNNKSEIFTYKTLRLTLPSSHKSSPSSDENSIDHNRIHLCRGHFKKFTIEKPLFGKTTGLFWWDPHVRGQNKDGIIIKDYGIDSNNEPLGDV